MKRTGAFALVLAFSIALCRSETASPSGDSILGRLHKEHPRILATSDAFHTLHDRVEKEGDAKRWSTSLRRDAEQILQQPPSKYEIPDGKRLLATSRRVLDRTLTLGLVFRLTNDPRYRDRIWTELDAAAHFPDWNPRHFLDTSEMTAAFAIGYDWLHDDWTPEQRAALKQAIVEKGLKQSLDIYRKDSWWAKAEHNWNQVCNGGMTLGALAVADEEPALSAEILEAAIRTVPRAMRHFAPDGAWGEGPSYWDYATRYNVFMLAALDTSLGTDFGLSAIDGFSKAGDFPIHMSGPLGRTFNYADAGDKGAGGEQLFWLASKFHTPAYAAWRIAKAEHRPTALDLLWGAAWLEQHPQLGTLPAARYFRGTEVVALRSGWNDPDATFVAFKGGDNRVNHGHLDLGSFVLDAMGRRWALDLGADDYNLPGYFGSKRWTYYRCRAEGQNTLVINPSEAPDQDPRAQARITRFEAGINRAFGITDLSAAYPTAAADVKRGILLSGRRVIVQDEIKDADRAEVWWFMHTPAKVSCDGATATLTLDGRSLTARILQPAGASFQVMPAEPLPSSPHPPRQQQKGAGSEHDSAGIRKLAIKLGEVTNATLVVQFAPSDDSTPPSEVKPLSSW